MISHILSTHSRVPLDFPLKQRTTPSPKKTQKSKKNNQPTNKQSHKQQSTPILTPRLGDNFVAWLRAVLPEVFRDIDTYDPPKLRRKHWARSRTSKRRYNLRFGRGRSSEGLAPRNSGTRKSGGGSSWVFLKKTVQPPFLVVFGVGTHFRLALERCFSWEMDFAGTGGAHRFLSFFLWGAYAIVAFLCFRTACAGRMGGDSCLLGKRPQEVEATGRDLHRHGMHDAHGALAPDLRKDIRIPSIEEAFRGFCRAKRLALCKLKCQLSQRMSWHDNPK